MTKELTVGETLYYTSDGPERLYYAPTGTQVRSEIGVVYEIDIDRNFSIVSGEELDDGFPPAELTVVSLG